MKYTILGFNQENIVYLNLSLKDIHILRWFIDFQNTEKMVSRYFNKIDTTLYNVRYQAIIDDLPILKINSKQTIVKSFEKFVEKGLLIHETLKIGGTFAYYGVTDLVSDLIYDPNNPSKKASKHVETKINKPVPKQVKCKINVQKPVTPVDNLSDSELLKINKEKKDKADIINKNVKKIFNVYPKKAGKEYALIQIKIALSKISFESLLLLTKIYRDSVKNNEDKDIMFADRWFKQEKYLDYEYKTTETIKKVLPEGVEDWFHIDISKICTIENVNFLKSNGYFDFISTPEKIKAYFVLLKIKSKILNQTLDFIIKNNTNILINITNDIESIDDLDFVNNFNMYTQKIYNVYTSKENLKKGVCSFEDFWNVYKNKSFVKDKNIIYYPKDKVETIFNNLHKIKKTKLIKKLINDNHTLSPIQFLESL